MKKLLSKILLSGFLEKHEQILRPPAFKILKSYELRPPPLLCRPSYAPANANEGFEISLVD